MAVAVLDGAGGRTAGARNILRPIVARVVADVPGRRRGVDPCRLGCDDAGSATAFVDRRLLDRAGLGGLPV